MTKDNPSDTDRLTYQDEGDGEDEGEDVAAVGLAVLAVALGEEDESGVDAVLAERLDQPRHGQQVGERCRESGGETTHVDEETPA